MTPIFTVKSSIYTCVNQMTKMMITYFKIRLKRSKIKIRFCLRLSTNKSEHPILGRLKKMKISSRLQLLRSRRSFLNLNPHLQRFLLQPRTRLLPNRASNSRPDSPPDSKSSETTTWNMAYQLTFMRTLRIWDLSTTNWGTKERKNWLTSGYTRSVISSRAGITRRQQIILESGSHRVTSLALKSYSIWRMRSGRWITSFTN